MNLAHTDVHNTDAKESALTWKDILQMFTGDGLTPPRVRHPAYSEKLFLPEVLQRRIQSRILSEFGRHKFDPLQRKIPSIVSYKADET